MHSRILAGLLVAACVTAAGGGAYVAVRQATPPSRAEVATPALGTAAPRPVSETEGVVDNTPAVPARSDAPSAADDKPAATAAAGPDARTAKVIRPERERAPEPHRRPAAAPAASTPAVVASRPPSSTIQPPERPAPAPQTTAPTTEVAAESTRAGEARQQAEREPQFEEVVVPASSVVGLQVETSLSSERTRLEDRVDARVTRDVTADGRVAIPAGSRVIGSVSLVERGGKMKDRARLGVRFHTLVLADGREVSLRTEPVIREGDSPTNESARKIGGAAIGGAILGAIMGGGKGAVMGGAAGAAGGSAVVMAGDRNVATLPAGTVVSVRLAAPATIEIERAPQ
jgi:hypothetical protein